MHLEDFATGEDEVRVFCDEHLPTEDVRIWFWRDEEDESFKPMGVRALTPNAANHKDGNHPNAELGSSLVDIDAQGVQSMSLAEDAFREPKGEQK
jgi:hypothetical protein